MDMKRAEEIINSKGIIEVNYKNSPVWIESLIEDGSTAHVKVLSTNETMNIPVSDLKESSRQ